MMQNKKAEFDLLIVLIAIGALAYFGVFNNFQNITFCHNHPEKCVCEFTALNGEHVIASTQICTDSQFKFPNETLRKKTNEELKIDKCNQRPEDTYCKCEEKRTEKITCLNNATIKLELINSNFSFSYLLKIKNNLMCYPINANEILMSINYPIGLRGFNQSVTEINSYNKTIEYECIKSRPKTECEKGNNNYIQYSYEKGGEQFEDCFEVPEFCYENNNYCDGIDSSKKLLVLHNESCNDYKILNPVCRPKNQCEKGNLDWVEEQINCWDYTQYGLTCPNQTLCREKTDRECIEMIKYPTSCNEGKCWFKMYNSCSHNIQPIVDIN